MFTVIEGIDGCGKDTQLQLLKKEIDFHYFKYPTRNYDVLHKYLNKKIILHPKALFLLFLADIAEEQEKLRKAADSGKQVIVDRYVFSTIAYELDSIGYENAKSIVEKAGFFTPDRVILLDLDPKAAQERKRNQKELDRHESDLEYQKKVRGKFLSLYEENFLAKEWIKLDASGSVGEVHENLKKTLNI